MTELCIWENSILFALFITFLLVEVAITIKTVHSKDIKVNRLSFVTYYFAIGQVCFTLIYLTPLLAKPELTEN